MTITATVRNYIDQEHIVTEPVMGIGTVILPIVLSPPEEQPPQYGKLRLTHVLHIPSLHTNIIAGRSTTNMDFMMHGDSATTSARLAHREDGKTMALFRPFRPSMKFIYRLWLRDPPIGPRVGVFSPGPPPRASIEMKALDAKACLQAFNETVENPEAEGPSARLEPM